MTKVGFIGLGIMGFPMSSHLSTKGFDTAIYNRTKETSKKWSDLYEGIIKSSPQDLEYLRASKACVLLKRLSQWFWSLGSRRKRKGTAQGGQARERTHSGR